MSRWGNGTFDVLHTTLERDGAVAEIYSLLSSLPIFPSKIRFLTHRLMVRTQKTLRLKDLNVLASLGVDNYRGRDYKRTQQIADAAVFLGFDGLIAPSARWNGLNLVLFTNRINPDQIEMASTDSEPIDWSACKKARSENRRS